jgi:uncharacterized radical SAM superfamily Fe-S cluster-containing enzyme
MVIEQPTKAGKKQVVMRRLCPCHGLFEFIIASDSRFYWLAQGNVAADCGCGPGCCSAGSGGKAGTLGLNATDVSRVGIIEKLSTCLALIEIVDGCDLPCDTCFADAPLVHAGGDPKAHSFDEIVARVQGVIARKGKIEVLQFSGGEPTMHPEFFRLIEWVRQNPNIDYLLINTNGKRIAQDADFAARLVEMYKRFDNIQLYLQFDGPQLQGQYAIRGFDIRALREQAILRCAESGLPITLAMVVSPETLPFVWNTVEYGLTHEHVRGVSFQPKFLSGRTPEKYIPQELPNPITVADVILGLNDQSQGKVALDDFTPLPCGDPNCAAIGWRFRLKGRNFSPSEIGIDLVALQKSLPDRINYRIEDLQRCGCENTPLGDLMKELEVKESNAFRLTIKPFMDYRTWDIHRIDRCCTHVIRPDGKLDSFCRYYGPKPDESCCKD